MLPFGWEPAQEGVRLSLTRDVKRFGKKYYFGMNSFLRIRVSFMPFCNKVAFFKRLFTQPHAARETAFTLAGQMKSAHAFITGRRSSK